MEPPHELSMLLTLVVQLGVALVSPALSGDIQSHILRFSSVDRSPKSQAGKKLQLFGVLMTVKMSYHTTVHEVQIA